MSYSLNQAISRHACRSTEFHRCLCPQNCDLSWENFSPAINGIRKNCIVPRLQAAEMVGCRDGNVCAVVQEQAMVARIANPTRSGSPSSSVPSNGCTSSRPSQVEQWISVGMLSSPEQIPKPWLICGSAKRA